MNSCREKTDDANDLVLDEINIEEKIREFLLVNTQFSCSAMVAVKTETYDIYIFWQAQK